MAARCAGVGVGGSSGADSWAGAAAGAHGTWPCPRTEGDGRGGRLRTFISSVTSFSPWDPLLMPMIHKSREFWVHLGRPPIEQVGPPGIAREGGFLVRPRAGASQDPPPSPGPHPQFRALSRGLTLIDPQTPLLWLFGFWLQTDSPTPLAPTTPLFSKTFAEDEAGAQSLTPGGLSLPIWALTMAISACDHGHAGCLLLPSLTLPKSPVPSWL